LSLLREFAMFWPLFGGEHDEIRPPDRAPVARSEAMSKPALSVLRMAFQEVRGKCRYLMALRDSSV